MEQVQPSGDTRMECADFSGSFLSAMAARATSHTSDAQILTEHQPVIRQTQWHFNNTDSHCASTGIITSCCWLQAGVPCPAAPQIYHVTPLQISTGDITVFPVKVKTLSIQNDILLGRMTPFILYSTKLQNLPCRPTLVNS